MNAAEEKEKSKDDIAKGIAYFWRSTNLEPRIRSVALCDGIAKIALGNHHTLILTFNSQLLSVGDNSFGQLGLGDFKPRREPTVIDYFDDKRVQEISCGGHHSGVVCANNEVYFWGDSSSGQCGVGENKLVNQPCQIFFNRSETDHNIQAERQQDDAPPLPQKRPVIKEIACGESHSLALSSKGEVWSWGTGCQLGHGVKLEQVNFPKQIEFLNGKNVTSIACGAYHSLAIIQGGESFPTFVFSKSEHDPATAEPKLKRDRSKKKPRKSSKGSIKKNQTSGKHHEGAVSPQKAKAEQKHETSRSHVEKRSVTRTYLSYEPAVSSVSKDEMSSKTVTNDVPTLEIVQSKNDERTAEPQEFDSLDYVQCSADGNKYVPCASVSVKSSNNENSSLTICDSHFGDSEETIVDNNKYFHINAEQTKSSEQSLSVELPESNENILYSSVSPPFPSSPTSDQSMLSFISTDSDSEDNRSRELDETSTVSKNSPSFYSALSSRLIRSDVNLSKLTSAVVGSVAGMFITSAPGQMFLHDPPKEVTAKMPCKNCGLLGLCLCDTDGSKFKLVGANTQVWSWGRGGCGQLGLGDTEDRYFPCCVETLSDSGITKLAAGTFHSLAQTACSQVFSWGDNSCGQLGRKKSMALQPKKIRCFADVLVWDIAAGSHYSLFIGDMAVSKPDIYVCGRQPSAMPNVAATMNSIKENRSMSLPLVASDENKRATSQPQDRPVLLSSQSFDDTKERSLQHCRVEIVRLTMFRTVGQLRSIAANTEHCGCLAASSDRGGKFEILSELASKERLFYYQLALIWQAVLTPLLQSEVWSVLALQEIGQVLAPIIKSFYEITKCVSSNQKAATQIVSSMKSFHELFKHCWSDAFLQAFERYSASFSNGVAFGVFTAFSNVSSDITTQSKAVLCDILDDSVQDFVNSENAFQYMMQFPLLKMQHYRVIVGKLLTIKQMTEKNTVDCARLQEEAERWEQFITRDENVQAQAAATQTFWQECPAKISETFKDSRRRLLRSSNIHSLYPSKGTRFSSPLYVLFDDFFVHFQSAKHFQAFPLTTVWAEGIDVKQGITNGIKITTPEEILLVCAPSTVDKADWLMTINQAVANVISKTTTYRLGAEALNLQTGSLLPAAAREASYTFEQEGVFCGATYHGMWLNGQPHGHGEMHWSDGRHYTGEFKFGLQHGEGILIYPPNSAISSREKYRGYWEDGKMSGYGKLRFCNGDVYKGCWRDNLRWGHGCMQSGSLASTGATMYIGEWSNDKRSGYGVLDDILKGEKYMGMWESDSRHGPGLLVTLDGIYNQGNFLQSKLMGHGVLLCDDNTKYEGEFVGECLLSGKGTLTMPNGDFIEGTFTGQWGEGIRINGTFHKLETTGTTNKSPRTIAVDSKYVIPPEKKWMSLFSECRQSLGCHGDRDPEHWIAWKCVSLALTTGRGSKVSRNDFEITKELIEINGDMEQTAKVCDDLLTIQAYLSKAFDLKRHPLGQLVNRLVDVFRASYVGMGTHRRLLPHAVAETKSFVIRVYSIVRLLFPELPNEEYVHLATDTVTGIANHSTEESLTSSMLLHPLLFPRLYPPLFTLYALDNERADSAYWEQIQLLNKRSDWALMTYVGMKRHFWLTREEDVGSRLEEVKLENREPDHYISAVESLQQISTKFSPMEKLAVLKTTFEKINEEVTSFWQGEKKLVSLDDLFPVFQFVVIRARIPHLGSEIHFIDDMVDSHVQIGEQGHMFTTLKASFFQIQNEKG